VPSSKQSLTFAYFIDVIFTNGNITFYKYRIKHAITNYKVGFNVASKLTQIEKFTFQTRMIHSKSEIQSIRQVK